MTVTDIQTLRPDPTLGDGVLDDPAWASLTGPHRRFSERVGGAARYQIDVAPFVALADHRDPQMLVITADRDVRADLSRALATAGQPALHLRRRGDELDEVYRRYFEGATA